MQLRGDKILFEFVYTECNNTQFFLKESNLREHDHPKLDVAVIEFENESETESESENETKKKKKGKQQGDGDIETMKKIKNKRNT